MAEANQAGLVNSDTDPAQLDYEISYWRRVVSGKTYPKPDANQWLQHLQDKGIVIDSENHVPVKMLCCYFAGDPRFETKYGGNLKKGILLRGPVGCGKTTLMRMFASNARQSFFLRACVTIHEAFASDRKDAGGPTALLPYFEMHRTGNVERYFGQSNLGVCFDDILVELTDGPAVHFGNRCNTFEKVFLQRYTNQLPFNATHGTTNASNDQLMEAYGVRAYDRMREVWNIIDFPSAAQSRRK